MNYKIRITKKSQSVLLPDVIELIKDYEKEEDGNFWYVYFTGEDMKIKKILDIVGGWKSTKFWIGDEEIPKYNRGPFESTIFCPYKERCQGLCMHDLDLYLYRYDWDDPFIEDKKGEQESIKGLYNWITSLENVSRKKFYRNNYRITLEFLMEQNILEKNDEGQLEINNENLEKIIKSKLDFELQYCPIILKDKTLGIITKFPDTLIFPDYLEIITEDIDRFEEAEILVKVKEDEVDNEYEYEKKQAELIGDEIEKRIRKVLSEFFEKK